jgi:HEAT repeat protein
MFAVVDLFKNVPAFDRLRPDSRTYRSMRYAAHKLAGESYEDGDFHEAAQAHVEAPLKTLRRELRAVEHAGSVEELAAIARDESDPRARIRALRALADHAGGDRTLLDVARDTQESEKVRAQAARYLGRTGPTALGALDGLAASAPPRVVKGVLLGYAELGTGDAVRRLVEHGADDALARVRNPDAIPALAEACRTSTAACTALANTRSPDAVAPLVATLRDMARPARVRAAAAEALGRLGDREALAAVTDACDDPHRPVVLAAKRARQRLDRG